MRDHFWKVEHRTLGGHVHVSLRCGPKPTARPLAGTLTVTVDEWPQLAAALMDLPNVEFEELEGT